MAAWSVVLPGPWVYNEVLGGQSAPFWCGTEGAAWAAVAGVWAVAALVVFLAGLAARWAVVRLVRRGPAAPLAGLVGMAALWAALDFLVADATVLVAAKAVLAPVVLAVLGISMRLLFGMPYRVSGVAGITALVGGIGTHEAAARYFLLEENRAETALTLSLWWMLLVGLTGALLMAFPRKGYRWYRASVAVLLAVALPAGLLVVPGLPVREDGIQQSLLLVTIDALRADYCSVYGGDNPTPNIDALARRGVVFDQAYVTAPWTLPSVYSMFASDYSPLWLPGQDFKEWGNRVRTAFYDLHEPTLAELYREKEYRTAAIIGNSLLYDRKRLLRGFDEIYGLPIQVGETHNPCEGMPLLGPALEQVWPELGRAWPLDSTRRITAYAQRFLQEQRGGPYFLWIHYMDPHDPYNPPDAYRDVPTEYAFFPPDPPVHMWDPAPKDPDWVKPENKIVIDAERLYAAEVRYVDDMLARVFNVVSPSTWVVLGADHGEEFFEHGRMSHRNTFYEESIHVPLIVAGPEAAPGRVGTPVSYVDLLPTLAGLTGLDAPDYWRGKSLEAFVTGPECESWDRPCFAGANDASVVPPSVMVVEGNMKLILNLADGSVELYDLAEDPREKNNLAADGLPAEAEALKAKAADWARSVTERHRKCDETPPPDTEQSEELRRQFEALGYL